MKIGIGYDIHALVSGRKLRLGGMTIPYPKGLRGHSDGDALLHAIVDAALGAAGEGDIGGHFPDTEAALKGRDSRYFAEKTVALLKKKKLRIAQVDSIVVAEAPKLGPWKDRIRRSVAEIFGLAVSDVNVKAKTNEGFGEIGKGKAIACHAVVALERV